MRCDVGFCGVFKKNLEDTSNKLKPTISTIMCCSMNKHEKIDKFLSVGE